MENYVVQDKWKTKNKMGECHPEGHFTEGGGDITQDRE